MPCTIDSDPLELLPIMPPSVARFDVDVSGPNPSPNRLAARLRSSCTTPGCTRTRRASGSIASITFMCREKSRTSPCPPAVCPASDVPPPRATIGTPRSAQMRTAALTSSAVRGKATAAGSTEYALASPANRCRV